MVMEWRCARRSRGVKDTFWISVRHYLLQDLRSGIVIVIVCYIGILGMYSFYSWRILHLYCTMLAKTEREIYEPKAVSDDRQYIVLMLYKYAKFYVSACMWIVQYAPDPRVSTRLDSHN
jgi:hypothetical protein